MKLVSYTTQNTPEALGFYYQNLIYPIASLNKTLPTTMQAFLDGWDKYFDEAQQLYQNLKNITAPKNTIKYSDAALLAPIPKPPSARDGYAFRQHVAAARRNRGVPMIPEFDEYPIFYFTNHHTIQGPGTIACMPDHFNKLDFELEAAIVINKKCTNVKAADADNYIAGLMIMNDMSARTLQMEEMLLNLGPAKGKDFSTVIGPMLVTLDELKPYEIAPQPNHTGKNWNLTMTCKVNGTEVSRGNLGDMEWTFAEIIERASYGVYLYPGDVIGSGTVGTGCFLELNGTAKYLNLGTPEQWLQPNDVVTMEIDELGVLNNTIVAIDTDYSILALKKKV